MDMQEPSYEELSTLVDSLREKIRDLKSTIDDMQDDLDESERDKSWLEDEVDELKEKIETLENEGIIHELRELFSYYHTIWWDSVKDSMLLEKVKALYPLIKD